MKTLYLFTILLTVGLFACSKSNTNTENSNLKVTLVAEPNTSAVTATQPRATSNNNVVAELDIKSYNAKTGEVVFNQVHPIEKERVGYNLKANVYRESTLLFSFIYASSIYSYVYNEPVLFVNGIQDGKWYILDGYPQGIPIKSDSQTQLQFNWREERDASLLKINSAWDTFVSVLKKEGKYIN